MVHSGKVWQFLIEFNLHLPYGQAILLLDNYTREMKTHVRTKTCIQMFLDVFSSITHNHQTLKQPKWPSVNKWINELWYNLQWKYCPVAKMKKLLIHRTTWLKLQCIMLNKSSLKMLHNIWLHLYDILELSKRIYSDVHF